MKGKEETVLEKAILELTQITEAADKNAKDKLAEKMSKDFDKLLKEELKLIKDNKESVNESIVDEKKEPVTEGKSKAGDNKESLTEMNNVDLTSRTFNDVEEAFDSAEPNSEFNIEDDAVSMLDIEKELKEMEGMANEADSSIQAVNAAEADPFNQMKQMYDGMTEIMKELEHNKMQEEMNNQFNDHMNTTFGESYVTDLGDDNINQLKEMFIARQKGDPFEKTAAVNENVEDVEEPTEELDEMHEKVPHGVGSTPEKGQKTDKAGITEDEEGAEEDKREEETVVDEGGHGIALSHNKHTGAEVQPRKEFADYKKSKYRYAIQKESWEKRMNSLLGENKIITKAFNAEKASKEEMKKYITEANDALSKYRIQLQEMAVFNTNLAYSNNILLDEEIALTADDKKTIVSEFKSVSSITESKEKYQSLLEGFKGTNKKTINEEIEDKVNDTIEPSSSQTIVEQVNEQTAYGNTAHLEKIKMMIDYEVKS